MATLNLTTNYTKLKKESYPLKLKVIFCFAVIAVMFVERNMKTVAFVVSILVACAVLGKLHILKCQFQYI